VIETMKGSKCAKKQWDVRNNERTKMNERNNRRIRNNGRIRMNEKTIER
jgi:hypothetical protein